MVGRRRFLSALFILPMALCAVGCDDEPRLTRLPGNSVVVALGDSLTFGYGASPDDSYPAKLAKKTHWQVLNMGVNGDTSQDVLARLDAVIAHKPRLVLLGIGGNDVLRRIDPKLTEQNIRTIIERLRRANIDVVLIAEPHLSVSSFFGKASDNPIYQQIADDMGVPLFAKEWSAILSDDQLKSDQIHANAQGYARFAESLYRYLVEIGCV